MNTDILRRWRPTLVIPDADGDRPVAVDRWLEFTGLYRLSDGRAETLIPPGRLDLERAEIYQHFAQLTRDAGNDVYLSAHLLDRRTDSDESTVDQRWLQEIRAEIGESFPAYVVSHDQALDVLPPEIKLPEALVEALKSHHLITYYFYFPVQDGFAFNTYPNSREGHWVGVSLLIDPASEKPVLAGFHGLQGVRIVPWDQVRRDRDGQPLAFVALGTRSLFEAPEDYDFETGLFGLEMDDSQAHSATIEFGPGGSGSQGGGDVWWILLLIALGVAAAAAIVSCFALSRDCLEWLKRTLCGDDDDEPATAPSDLDDAQGQLEASELPGGPAPSGTDPWQEPTDSLPEPTVRGSESVPPDGVEARPSQLIEARTRRWWPARMAWGELDLHHPGLMRFAPGRPRPALELEFVLGALERLD